MTAQHNAALNSTGPVPATPRPQDMLGGLQQRPGAPAVVGGRIITGPNGEVIRAPGAVVPPPAPTPIEPTKLQYSGPGVRPQAPPPAQHRPGPYYGHNPNLKC